MKLPHTAVAVINFAFPLRDRVAGDFTWTNLGTEPLSNWSLLRKNKVAFCSMNVSLLVIGHDAKSNLLHFNLVLFHLLE